MVRGLPQAPYLFCVTAPLRIAPRYDDDVLGDPIKNGDQMVRAAMYLFGLTTFCSA
jgi:hypothetical protein